MKLDQLFMFKSVAELGSLSKASKQLCKTQPAISQGIRQLERSLKLELFNRDSYRLELTDVGKKVFQHTLRILNETSALEQVANHIYSGNESSIILAIEASFDLSTILPILEQMQSQFPDTQIELKQEYIKGAFDSLQNNKATMCISPIEVASPANNDIEFHYLMSGRLLNVVSPDLLARHPDLMYTEELIDEYQIFVKNSGTPIEDKDWGVQDGQRCWQVNDYLTKSMLIEKGMGWGKVPYHTAKESLKEKKLVALNLKDQKNEVQLKYMVMKNKNQLLGPVSQAFWDLFKTYRFSMDLDKAQVVNG